MEDTAKKVAAPSAFSSQVLTLLGAIASGIGVAGFAAVVGGVVVWLRFDALGLPADTAVAAMPRTELVVIGVSTLLPFIVLGLVLVVVAYLCAANSLVPGRSWVDLPTVWSGIAPGPDGSAPAGATARPPDPETEAKIRLTTLGRDARSAAGRASTAGRMGRPSVVEDQVAIARHAEEALTTEFRWLDELPTDTPSGLVQLKPVLAQVRAAVAAAKTESEKAKLEARSRQGRSRATLVISTLLLLAVEMALVFVRGAPSPLQTLLLAAISLLLTATTLKLAWSTPGFAVFGTSIFVAMLLFGTATTLLGTYHTPKVQPIALLRSGQDTGLTGFFVAETSDRIYLVRIQGEHEGSEFQSSFPRMVVVPRSNVASMEIGPLQTQAAAYGTSYRQLLELCAQRVKEPEAGEKTQPKTSTTPATLSTPLVKCGQQH